jgi:hypothetical protein
MMLLLADRISTEVPRIADSLQTSRATPRIARLLPAMERFIPEFIFARGAM